MDEPRPVSDPFLLRIKAATRDLVRQCGGVVRAGEVCDHSKTEVSRWQNVGHQEVIDLASAYMLEADCDLPLVTSVMAEAHGRRLTDEHALHSAASINARHSDLLRSQGELSVHMASALEDGTVTPAEAEQLDRAASEMEARLRDFRAGLAAVRATGPAPAGARLRAVE